jgi:hypothetical protein
MQHLTWRRASRPCLILIFTLIAAASVAAPAVETVSVGVAAGIDLATDIYRPEKEPAPVILIRTPYGRKGYDFLGEAFSGRGFVVMVQDVRGKYDSTGEYEPFIHEREDGLSTLRWIERQPWCNGRIGIWGQSYSGFAGLVVADADLGSLRSIMSFSGWLEAEEIVRPGGASHLMLNLPWMLTQQGKTQRGLGGLDIDALFRHTPLVGAMRAAGIPNSTWEAPDFMKMLGARREIGEVTRPVLHVTGWSDMVYRGSLHAWDKLSAHARAPQKLIVGPWFHDQMMMGTWEVGDADFGAAAGFGVDEFVALSLEWFEATLMGKGAGFVRNPPVTVFMMGQNAWQTLKSWPPSTEEIESQRWYFDSGGRANSSAGNGSLSLSDPSGSSSDRFVFDPMDPVPTLGGANFHFFPEKLGVRDQRGIEERPDVLVYTSEPLAGELQLTGPIEAVLHVASSGADTDFTAKLVAVRPDGYARIVVEGIARASALLDKVPPPGSPITLRVEMGATAIAIPAGHRLRVEISSSNFPRYDRNPNTGESAFTATVFRKADQTLFHDIGRASHVVLPVLKKPLTASVEGTKPLVEPFVPEAAPAATAAGGDPAELLARGQEELGKGEVDKAVASLERAVELKPQGSVEYYWLGRAYLEKLQDASMLKKLGLSKQVRESYLKAIELDPESVEVRSSLAQFDFNAPGIAGGSDEKGMEQVAEIRKRDPKAAHLLMAGRYTEQKEVGKAKEEYRAALALGHGDATIHYRLGMIHQEEKAWAEAFDAFESGVRAAGNLSCLYQIGRTGALSGMNLDRAKEALEEYITREDRDPRRNVSEAGARWRLGMIHERMGRKDLARKEYERSLALDPDFEQAREALKKLE